MTQTIVGMLIVAMSVAVAGVASAEDFTLNVPVKVSNLLATAQGVVLYCNVKNASGQGVGAKQTAVTAVPADGNLTQTITVKFNADTGKDPGTATTYFCQLNIAANNAVNSPGNCPASVPECKAKAGTTLVHEVTGNLPQ